jgi:hypothetical protein
VSLVVHLSRTSVVCECGVRVVPDPALPAGTVLHECPDCLILQAFPAGKELPWADNAVVSLSE